MSLPPLIARGTVLAQNLNWPFAALLMVALICLTVLAAMRVISVEVITHAVVGVAGILAGSSSGLVKQVSTGVSSIRPPAMPYPPTMRYRQPDDGEDTKP